MPWLAGEANGDAKLHNHEDDHSAYDANDGLFEPTLSMMVRL